jgi:hypothetical protein
MPGVPADVATQLATQMRRPEGTVHLVSTCPGLHNPVEDSKMMGEVITGRHIFRLLQTGQSEITGVHGSPGGGTQLVTADVSHLAPEENLDTWLGWSPRSIILTIVDPLHPGELVRADGTSSPYELWVSRDGTLVEVANTDMETLGIRVYSAGRKIVSPPAIHLWRDTLRSVKVLLSGQSPEGYMYEVVTANAALSALVTGFESYCHDRFLELEDEGIYAKVNDLILRFGTKEERDQFKSNGVVVSITEAEHAGSSALEFIADNRINFQSLDHCKRAFNKGYGITFGRDLGLTSQELNRLQRLLVYRHRIVHVSPLISLLNALNSPPEAPEFSNKSFAESSLASFDRFVEQLHEASLRLRIDGATDS